MRGLRFERLTVVMPDPIAVSKAGKPFRWICRCDCGAQKSIAGTKLRDRNIRSCGCLARGIVEQEKWQASPKPKHCYFYDQGCDVKMAVHHNTRTAKIRVARQASRISSEGDMTKTLSILDQGKFDFYSVTETGIDFKPETPRADWLKVVESLCNMFEGTVLAKERTLMLLADSLNFGQDAFGEEYAQAIDDTKAALGLSPKTVANAQSIYKKIRDYPVDAGLKSDKFWPCCVFTGSVSSSPGRGFSA